MGRPAGRIVEHQAHAPGHAALPSAVPPAPTRETTRTPAAGKGQVGLDQHQVRRWTSWHRFITLAPAALAVLAICDADARTADRHARPDMIELTVNGIRRLINILLIQPTRSIAYRLHWQTGDAGTRHEPDEPTTPAASTSNNSHDHEWQPPIRR